MQCLTLKENFIFTCQIKYRLDQKNSELTDNTDSILLITIKAIYIFEPTSKNKPDDFLENKLILKCLHENVYIEKYSNEINEIKYISEDPHLKFIIKLETPLAKEYIKILSLFEGWKIAVKKATELKDPLNLKEVRNTDMGIEEDRKKERRNTKNYNNITEGYPNIIYLFQIIDSFIQHDYVFQIDYLIMQLYKEYPNFLKEFFYVISIFNKVKIDLLIDDQISDVFPNLLPQDTYINNIPVIIKYSLIHLSLKSSNLKDSFAKRILPIFIVKSPFLQTLDLSYNYLTNLIFQVLIVKDFININLKTLNVSYNQLSNDNLSKFIFQISKQFLCITLFDLRGNKIDNRFLNNFNPKAYEELRNIIQEKLSGNNQNNNYNKENIVFDLRDTNINIEKTSYRLYLKKKKDLSGHLEIKNNFSDNYETKFFGLENINFIFDLYFFNKNNYKYSGCSKSKSKLNVDVKYYQLRLPSNIKEKKIQNDAYNNWFKTQYYNEKEKEEYIDDNEEKNEEACNDQECENKKEVTIQTNNDICSGKKKKTFTEEAKSKSGFYQSNSENTSSKKTNQKKSKKTTTLGKESKASMSKYSGKDFDSRLYEQTIVEEYSEESLSDSGDLEESEERKSSEDLDENNIYSSKRSNTNKKS